MIGNARVKIIQINVDAIPSSFTTDIIFLKFLSVVRLLPIRELVVRSFSDLGQEVWSHLCEIRGLNKVAIWCMEGPPRVLQGWADKLGETLTHLELGVSVLNTDISVNPCALTCSCLTMTPALCRCATHDTHLRPLSSSAAS